MQSVCNVMPLLLIIITLWHVYRKKIAFFNTEVWGVKHHLQLSIT